MQYLSPYPGNKKRLIFGQREQELRHALKNNLGDAKVKKAAERLKSAKLQLIEAFQYAIAPAGSQAVRPSKRLKNLEDEKKLWSEKSIETIIDNYRSPPNANPTIP